MKNQAKKVKKVFRLTEAEKRLYMKLKQAYDSTPLNEVERGILAKYDKLCSEGRWAEMTKAENDLHKDLHKRSGKGRLPAHAMPNRIPKFTRKSNFLQQVVFLWGKSKGFCPRIIDVKGTYIDGKYIQSGATKGVEDVQILAEGLFIAVEVKVGRDKMSTHQERQRELILRNCGVYLEAKDIDIVERLEEVIAEYRRNRED